MRFTSPFYRPRTAVSFVGTMRRRLGKAINAIAPGPVERQRRRAIDLFHESKLFDQEWYQSQYPDVANGDVDPARHYLIFGWREGRDPGPGFSTVAYLRANADVADLAINPLLHYIEHGHAEGRGTSEHASPIRKKLVSLDVFGPAAPCATFARESKPHLRWRHRENPMDTGENVLSIDGQFVGKHRDPKAQTDFQAAFDLLAWLSGFAGRSEVADVASEQTLIDAWHAGGSILRTRWRPSASRPIVVRAIQFLSAGPILVGEGLIESELDTFDAKLESAYFPILFIVADTKGLILAWETLGFPSLCRGGVHYPEFLASSAATNDLLSLDRQLVTRLVALLQAGTAPFLSMLKVDLRGVDASQPLFQPDFQRWLGRVARLPVQATDVPLWADLHDLADAVPVDGGDLRNAGQAALTLPSDMIPSLSAIVGNCATEQGADREVSFIIAGEERARPSMMITLPADLPDELPSDFIPLFPRFSGGRPTGPTPVLAIRAGRSRPLSEAELLVPIAATSADIYHDPIAITFVVPIDGQSENELADALDALSLQTNVGPVSIILVGKNTSRARQIAASFFTDVRHAADSASAAAGTTTEIVGFLGPGVILHDRRTVVTLANYLSDPAVASASAVLVSVEQRGKGWLVAPSDVGEIDMSDQSQLSDVASALWRGTIPQVRPPKQLWLARKESLRSWFDEPRQTDQLHLCTSRVTASLRVTGSLKETIILPPSTTAARYRALVG